MYAPKKSLVQSLVNRGVPCCRIEYLSVSIVAVVINLAHMTMYSSIGWGCNCTKRVYSSYVSVSISFSPRILHFFIANIYYFFNLFIFCSSLPLMPVIFSFLSFSLSNLILLSLLRTIFSEPKILQSCVRASICMCGWHTLFTLEFWMRVDFMHSFPVQPALQASFLLPFSSVFLPYAILSQVKRSSDIPELLYI